MKENTQIMSEARASLNGKWPLAIGTFLILLLISMGAALIPLAGQIIGILIAGPLAVGGAYFALNIVRDQVAQTDDLFFSFNNNLSNSILAYLLVVAFALIGFVLLIIPGVIVALALSQTWFILAENPSMDSYDAIMRSKKMMDGYKFKLFKIQLRLLGLGLLCLLTLGIGFLWLIPYQYVVYAKFYEEVKAANA
ncbi:MAG: DUF975 family protein [Flavobacteriaceae bacterium]|nr:DUF975 family protein [Flavobacteriaceae bacterium]